MVFYSGRKMQSQRQRPFQFQFRCRLCRHWQSPGQYSMLQFPGTNPFW
jgi:hypothetical protein